MITVEKAIKDNKTKKAVEGEGKKPSNTKKYLIGAAIIAGAYIGYKMLNGKNEKV